MNRNDKTVGYSAFILFEDAYLYNEDSCFIISTKSSMIELLNDLDYSKQEYKVEEVSLDMMKSDYGVSCGRYILDKKSFENFKEITRNIDMPFKFKPNEYDEELIDLDL
ncbi:MAG: hypothetical protein ACI9FG_001368 [Crocinitomicaceae bacterium]|jgi:hypothetical protein